MNIWFVMIGGFFGAISRSCLGEWIQTDGGFPFATLLVNLIGCFLLGWLLTFMGQRKNVSPGITLFFGTGFIGSFTTFSTFSVETIQLFQNGLVFFALLYILISICLGLCLTFIGYKIALSSKKEW